MKLKSNKHIPLDKFIDLSLYHPQKGFYMKKNPIGKKGDFITSPNISILFSEMIAIWIVAFWENLNCPKKMNIVELGGGNGEMLKQILSSSEKFPDFNKSCNFFIHEKSPFLVKIQKFRLGKSKVIWIKNFKRLNNYPTIFIANEFFDALPIKQFIKKKNKWYEKYVDLSDLNKLKFIKKSYKIENLKSKLKININNQNFIEYSPSVAIYLKKISKIILKNRGGLLIIDYGNFNSKMYDSLKIIQKHKIKKNLGKIGDSDITYDLNFNLLRKILTKFKLRIAGSTTQGNFLKKLGILQRAEIVAKNMIFSKKTDLYFRLKKLINKDEMGTIFKVVLATNKKNNFNLGFK